ncbi:TIGR03084 family metal-binding protein [Nocardioides iriomotensis]|uniref:TIGR03084 family protein n=1 Tax=Nocardioides iriomotensis TaxID=715784 RepID=A0A4Q5IWM9_9ACTN|nr:TIGR03084 family metal-binding protein [Nocardioides iriomotensis]RYU10454.1 TIGR03084 family protein [Nocardioides iriomotensis]
MTSTADLVLTDLDAECAQLDALVANLPDDETGWRKPTPAAGWDVAHQVAHLAWTDEVALKAATDKQAWDAAVLEAIADPDGHVDTAAAEGAAAPGLEVLARWRASRSALVKALRDYPTGERIPWYGPPMSPTSMATARFMETWAHARDVADALGVTFDRDDRVRHVVHLGIRTRGYAFAGRGLDAPADPIHVSLVLPSGDLHEDGPADADQSVRGSAYDFALLVTQRVHRADTDLVATGPDADRWLDVAQAFAGPAGDGREPRAS